MLICITEFFPLLGFVLSFVLLSCKTSEGNPITGDEFNVTSTEDESLYISSLPFVHHLINPCYSSGLKRRRNRIMEAQRTRYAAEFYKFLAEYSLWYKRDAQQVIHQRTLTDCMDLGLEILPNTPNFQQLQGMDAESAMNEIYASLLIHSAHVYFIHHQYKEEERAKCPQTIPYEKQLASESLALANKQKSLICTIDSSMHLLGYSRNSTDSLLLEHQLTNLRQCSRMALRDCQVLRSVTHLLEVIANYARVQRG